MRDSIYWIDPYDKKSDKELQAYATCVIDGYGWRLTPQLKTYCAGKVEDLIRPITRASVVHNKGK